MKECRQFTPAELADWVAAGKLVHSGPHASQTECFSVCNAGSGSGSGSGPPDPVPVGCCGTPIPRTFTAYLTGPSPFTTNVDMAVSYETVALTVWSGEIVTGIWLYATCNEVDSTFTVHLEGDATANYHCDFTLSPVLECDPFCFTGSGTLYGNLGSGERPFGTISLRLNCAPSGSGSGSVVQVPIADDCGCGPNVEPDIWRFTISGASAGTEGGFCTSAGCTALNATHDLAYVGKIAGLCYWAKNLGVDPGCGTGGWIVYVTDGTTHQVQFFTSGATDLAAEFSYNFTGGAWNCTGDNIMEASEFNTADCAGMPSSILLTPA